MRMSTQRCCHDCRGYQGLGGQLSVDCEVGQIAARQVESRVQYMNPTMATIGTIAVDDDDEESDTIPTVLSILGFVSRPLPAVGTQLQGSPHASAPVLLCLSRLAVLHCVSAPSSP